MERTEHFGDVGIQCEKNGVVSKGAEAPILVLRENNAAKERSPEHADELSKMSELLLEMKKAKEERIAAGYDGFTTRTLKSYLSRYNK